MPYPHLDSKVNESQHLLARVLNDLRTEFDLPQDFAAGALAEAEAAVAAHQLPETDLTSLEFVTIDPPSSTDLDQAMYIETRGGGYAVWYAIADVPSFVAAGGELDAETRRRGQTIYAPDGRIPLHPDVIGEQAGSLLADQVRSAYVWRFELDAGARVTAATVERARVRSRAKLNYEQVQQDIDSGDAAPTLLLLKEVGLKRVELERERGGASLNVPDQEIAHDGRHYFIVTKPPLPVEDWNAQISLMTGMAAARIMLEGRIGILRTMPGPDAEAEAQYRRQTEALGFPWPQDVAYGDYLRSLDTTDPRQLALMHAATALFRGAGYTPFDGELPAEQHQAAIAAPYAHTTAPLRRLVDRFVLVICHALCAGEPVPQWARDALDELPKLMAASDQLAGRVDRAALDAVETALLSHRVGEEFDAVVITGTRNPGNGNGNGQANGSANGNQGSRNGTGNGKVLVAGRGKGNGNGNGQGNGGQEPYGVVQLSDPPVTARCSGVLEAGATVRVRLSMADIQERRLRFELAGG